MIVVSYQCIFVFSQADSSFLLVDGVLIFFGQFAEFGFEAFGKVGWGHESYAQHHFVDAHVLGKQFGCLVEPEVLDIDIGEPFRSAFFNFR